MKKLLIILLLAITSVAHGQTVNLTDTYGIIWRDTLTLGQRYTYAAAKKKYPAWVGYMEYTGASSKVLLVREFDAASNDAVWANDDAIGVTNYANGCGSRVNIVWPAGVFFSNIELMQPQGTIWGQGTQGWALDTWPMRPGGTTIRYDRAHWVGDPKDRYLIKDITWGLADNFGYTEGAQLHQVKILGEGTGLYDPTQHVSAIGAWKRGEVSDISDVFVYRCNDYAIELRGHFHATFCAERVSMFLNGKAGVGIIGGGHFQGRMLSFDDNGACFDALPDEKGSIGNGTHISVSGIKFETGKTAGRPYSRGQELLNGEGIIKAEFFGLDYSRVNAIPHELIRIKSTDQISYVKIEGISWFSKPYALIHDRVAKTYTLMDPGEYMGRLNEFYWRSDVGMVTSSGLTLQVIPATCDDRLAPLQRDPMTGSAIGGWNGCSPAYSYTQPVSFEGGPSVPPVVDGPVVVPPIVVPPVVTPPSTKVIANYNFTTGTPASIVATTGDALVQPVGWQQFTGISKGVLSNSNSNASYPVAWKGVTHITITGLTWSGTPGYQSLMGNASGSIKVYPDGSVVDTRGNHVLASKGTVTAGKSVDLDLTIAPMDVSYFGAVPGNGNCWKGSMTGFILQ